MANKQSGRGNSLWVCLLWSVGAFDVVDVWGGLLWALQRNYCEGCVSNKQSGRGSFLWVCLLWFMGASDVVSVCACVTVGVAAPCRYLLARRVWVCVCLMSKVGVAALCGCVSCGLWVPLMWLVCGHGLLWALRPLASVYWPGGSL